MFGSSSDSEMVKFRSVEVLSLYTTMVLKRLITSVQPVEVSKGCGVCCVSFYSTVQSFLFSLLTKQMPMNAGWQQLGVVSNFGANSNLSGSDRLLSVSVWWH